MNGTFCMVRLLLEGKEARKERLIALLARLRVLLAPDSESSLARTICVSLPAINRINARINYSLSGENRKNLCRFLDIPEVEFDQYLEGMIDLASITRNVSPVEISNSEVSAKALQIFKEQVLPKLMFADCLEAMRSVQTHFWALVDDHVFVKRSTVARPYELLGDTQTIAQLLQGQNLDVIAERVNLDRGRLGAIAAGQEPACEELTLLSASLGIPIKDLELLREQQFGKNHHEKSLKGDKK